MTTINETLESAEREISSLISAYIDLPLPLPEVIIAGLEKRVAEHPKPDSICLSVSLRKKQITALFEFSTLRTQIKQKQLRLQQLREQTLEDEMDARKRRLLAPATAPDHPIR